MASMSGVSVVSSVSASLWPARKKNKGPVRHEQGKKRDNCHWPTHQLTDSRTSRVMKNHGIMKSWNHALGDDTCSRSELENAIE